MKSSAIALICFAPAITLCGGAVYLAANGIAGWGWFLFVACLLGGKFSDTDKTTKIQSGDK